MLSEVDQTFSNSGRYRGSEAKIDPSAQHFELRAAFERAICDLLSGEPVEWRGREDSAAIREFLDTAAYHGVLPLLHAVFRRHSDLASWPKEIVDACHRAALAQTGYELLHGAEVERVLAALANETITPLLLKGTGLAYSLYASPTLRPRADTDLLVAPEAAGTAHSALAAIGYRRVCGPAGRYVGYQTQLRRRDAHGLEHDIDLHWRISNVQSFAWMFSFAEMAAATVPVPALNSRARRLGNVHALMLCLLHRAGNRMFATTGVGERLIWLYDIRLLVSAMTDAELADFRSTAEIKRVGALAIDGLRCCADRFPSPRLADLIDALAQSAQATTGSALLNAGRWRREWMEFHAIPSRLRLAYVAERALPANEYMRERYPDSLPTPVTALHVRRWIEGLGKLLLAR
jgi:hypothetical protein